MVHADIGLQGCEAASQCGIIQKINIDIQINNLDWIRDT